MKNNEETKKVLKETVKELLKTRSNITVKDIADHAFVNIAAVNYHFSSKDNLVNICVGEIMDDFKSDLLKYIMVPNKSSEEAIGYYLRKLNDFFEINQGLLKYILTLNGGERIIVDSIFNDKEFSKIVVENIMNMSNLQSYEEGYAKFLIVISSIIFPCLLDMQKNNKIEGRKDFDNIYIKELAKVMK